MARINIEDSIHTDRRFFDLILKVGDLDKAYGLLIRTWIVAQKWYLTPEKMIPAREWEKQLISEAIIETGWAERVGDFVRVCGADKQFAWLTQRVEAGRKGGAAQRGVKLPVHESAKREGARVVLNKAIKSGKIIKPKFCSDCGLESQDIHGHHSDYSAPLDVIWLCRKCHNKTHALLEADAKRSLAGAKRPKAVAKPSSSLLSSPSSLSSSNSESYEGVPSSQAALAAQSKTQLFIAGYCKRFKSRYGSNPEIRGKDSGIAKRISEGWSTDKIDLYLDAFFAMPDATLVKRKHPLADLEFKLNEVTVFAQTGAFTTQRQAYQADDAASNMLLLQKVREGSA